ncbi:MAG TPA: polymer-forming cytoskeletal protein [Firmicutes bacterium]|nr:polymer-forming cytoskeletal protein [Bacillota bacterium]
MFAVRKKDEINYDQVDTILGRGTEFKGNITARGTLRIEGRVEGDISVEGDVIISESGRAAAKVKARHVTVAGELEGELDLEGRLEIAATGKVRGKIRVANLAVNDGGFFLGSCEMRGAQGGSPEGKGPVSEAV